MTIEVKNFYKLLPKKYKHDKPTYPNFSKIRIELPFRSLIIGASGSGKTNLLLNIISNINAWNKIFLIAKNTTEPLYQFLIDVIKEVELKAKTNILTVGNNIDDIPDIDTFNPNDSNLLILDDLISEKESKLNNINAIFIRGRKQNLSTIFISQSYFKIPLMIRQNADYMVLKKINSSKDLKRIVSEYSLDLSADDIMKLYKYANTGELTDFFLIDLITTDYKYKYRKNFEPI